MSDMPIINMSDENGEAELRFALSTTGSSSDYRNDRDRPYNGQSHTTEGIRGNVPLVGLTMRDVRDCFIKALLMCCGIDQPELYDKAEQNTWRTPDVWKVDMENIDPMAVAQNLTCEMEKMMGIYPNCPSFDVHAMLEGFIDE